MANLFSAIQELRARPWFPKSVRDIRAFRLERWPDFTALVREGGSRRAPLQVREPVALHA